jgi:two-component system CheB/CheR fusion protein
MQDRVIPLFHYSLVQDGFLFLGTSENVTRHSRLFATVDKTHRIFRKRAHLERRVPEFPLTSPATRRAIPHTSPRPAGAAITLKATAERQVLERFAPAHVVINAEGDVLQSSGRTGKYLELPPGAPDTNIFNRARPGLRLELRAAMHKAMGGGQLAMQPKITVGTNGGTQEIDLYVQPLKFGSASEPLYLVAFQDLGPIVSPVDRETTRTGDIEEESVRHLEAELRSTRERLQTTTEELESSNEELKSSNEELQSINEELQSANEELETSKEELQSINEELQTVNSELNARVEELSRTNNDMSNLLESTQIATVFLDRSLLVKSFTPAAKDVFRLVESDAGRPIMHVRPRFNAEGLQEDAERVLRTLTTIERPVSSIESEARYVMRLLPYRTTDNIINGVVITFTDITRISAAEARINELTGALRARIDELETILELVPVGVMIAQNDDNPDIRINAYGARLFGTEEHRQGPRPATRAYRLFQNDREVPRPKQPLERAMRTGEPVSNWDGRLENERGQSTHVMISATPLFAEGGAVRGAVAAIVDISLHKQAEAQQQFLLSELQHRVKNILATVSSLATRMLRAPRTVDEFRDAFLARLRAMSRTHALLASAAWRHTNIRALVQAALEPYATTTERNISLSGEDVGLNSQTAAALGMVFHELATNAAKYGALSRAGGQVEVSWRQAPAADGQPGLHLVWTEHGGPDVDSSATQGFGTSFITRCVEYELAGRAEMEFLPHGVRCTIEFPLSGNA